MSANYKVVLFDIDNQIKALQKREEDIKEQWIKAECPVSIGDIIIINGYAYEGKKMVVDSIYVRKDINNYKFVARGTVLKKDETKSMNRGQWISDGI